jgi:chromosome segregation ATPase
MNKKFLLLLALFVPSIVLADTLSEQIEAAKAGLRDNTAQLDQKSHDGTEASAHYAHLQNDVLPLIQESTGRYKADRADLDQELSAMHAAYQDLGQRLAVHNGNRCEAPEDNPSVCDAYNSEADQLDQEAADLATRRDKDRSDDALLEQRRQGLVTQFENLSADTQETFQKIKDARSGYDDLLQVHNRLLKTLQALQSQAAQCQKQLKAKGQGSDDYLKNRCGDAQFDGSDYDADPPPPDPPA